MIAPLFQTNNNGCTPMYIGCQILFTLLLHTNGATTETIPELFIHTYKRNDCEGRPLTTTPVEYCASQTNRKGLYERTVCTGTSTVTYSGFKDKSCRGTPQTYSVDNVDCIKNERGGGSFQIECNIPEPYAPSPSNASASFLSLSSVIAMSIASVLLWSSSSSSSHGTKALADFKKI